MAIPSNLAVVLPVRAGSSRIKNKISIPFFYKEQSLLEWKIRQLLEILPAHQIFVSTEDDELKNIGRKYNVSIHHRENYLSVGHQASFSEVITGVVKEIDAEHIAWLTVVVPLMGPSEYIEGFNLYNKKVITEKTHDSLVSVNLLKEYFWDNNGPINYRADKHHTISQELPDIYRVTNGLYIRDKQSILDEGYFLGPNPYKHQVSKLAGIDIDELIDFEMAEHLVPLYFKNK